MAKFIIRRFLLLLLTMVLVSIAVFMITESSPGNVARNVLGAFITPEQEKSFLAQMGLDKPAYVRYINWLIGSDWRASGKVGLPLERTMTEKGFVEWWARLDNGNLIRWKLDGESPDILVCGHTHLPFARRIGGTLVVNCGSAGQPVDGDPRPPYALIRIEKGSRPTGRIVRFSYPIGEVTAALERSSLPKRLIKDFTEGNKKRETP